MASQGPETDRRVAPMTVRFLIVDGEPLSEVIALSTLVFHPVLSAF